MIRYHKALSILTVMIAFFVALYASVQAQTPSKASTSEALTFSPSIYRIGERLSYNVSFSSFSTAAHVDLFVAGRGTHFSREGIELRAHVETIGLVNAALFSLNNDYITYIDPATGLPFRTQQIIREGARTSDTSRDHNQSAGPSTLPVRETAGGFPGTYDLLSALYRLRALPLAQGATYPFTVQYNENEYQAELKVVGRETLRTSIGSSNAIATQIFVRGNKEVNDYRIQIYFTDDQWHIPLLIKARHPAGEIRAEISSADIQPEVPTAQPTVATTPPPTKRDPKIPPVSPDTERSRTPDNTAPGPAASAPATNKKSLPGLPFDVGEELNFNFFLGNAAQPIGTAFFHVRARNKYFNQDGLLLTASMQTTGAAQNLFPVNDQISSYVDATTLLPFRTELRLQEGKRRTNWIIELKQDLGTATFNDGAKLEIPVGTHDLVSVFYALRSFDLSPTKRNAVSLLINKNPRLLIITALQRQTIEIGGQSIPAIQLSLVTDDPQPDRFNLRLWVSTDSRRLPLRLTAMTPLGPVRADLAIIPVTNQ